MSRQAKPIRSDIAWSRTDRITVRGRDLPGQILGHMNLGEFAFFQLIGQEPTPQQSAVFNAIIITLVEHGLTPSAIAARLTYSGAPESMHAAVASGLCGLGLAFVGSMEDAARMLSEALPERRNLSDTELAEIARDRVAAYRQSKRILPGLGHPIHKPVDARAPRLFEIAAANDMAGPYVRLIQAIAAEAERVHGRSLPVNATGAIGAICCEFGFPWRIVRGFGVMARAIGLVGHILEEHERPIAREVWLRVDDEATAHLRPA
jgi:citrate synthase